MTKQEKAHVYYLANREKILAYAQAQRARNRDENRFYLAMYRCANSEKLKTQKLRQVKIIRALLWEIKSGPCKDCGNCYPPYVMDLDHVRGVKIAGVGSMLNHSEKTFLAEVAKCELVCANCHRERTHKRRTTK